MEFDIQYLLFLQDFRNATGGAFDECFNLISKFAVSILIFLPFIVFWGIDKKWGYYFQVNLFVGEVVNGLIKLTVCAYRPWIRSDLIQPAGDSKAGATGYSFPSGHTQEATSLYGSVISWQNNKRKWLAILCGVMIFLTGFSRNFLGVHTPQDVVVGFIASLILLIITAKVAKKIEDNDKAKDLLSLGGIIFVIVTLAYIQLKSYPMDYDASGNLLADPQKMMNGCFRACGGVFGLSIGSYMERHFIKYEIPKGSKLLPILVFVGVTFAMAWKGFIANATIVPAFGKHWGRFLMELITLLFVVCLWPMVIKKICK